LKCLGKNAVDLAVNGVPRVEDNDRVKQGGPLCAARAAAPEAIALEKLINAIRIEVKKKKPPPLFHGSIRR
jgi:hypothetical protein